MLDYPVRIEMLSRFRSQSEQKVLQLLREGGVDIVIGTHRLISGDVVFKDLGLVVIDEEQRFDTAWRNSRTFPAGGCADALGHPDSAHLYLSLVGVKNVHDRELRPQPSARRNSGVSL
jgi:transcription-repair coupling factor (superfamily II helicase)